MKGLDFKDWEKISEDNKSTTLRHAKGHVMMIAHGALPKIQKEQLKRLKFADGTPGGTVGDVAAEASDPSAADDSSYADMIKAMAGNPQVASVAPRYTGQGPYEGPDPVAVPQVAQGGGGGIGGVLNTEQQGVTQREQIAAQKAKADAFYQDQYLKQTQAQKDRDDQDIQTVNHSVQALDNYVKTKPINKNAIFENMTAAERITNAIGLIVGGFTGGFNGTGVNPALNTLIDQQNKDIQAQKDRMDQQETVFGAYHKAYGDDVIASNLARVSYNNGLIHQGALMAAKLGTAQAAQDSNMLSATLNKDNYLKLGQVARRARAIQAGQIPAQNSDPHRGGKMSAQGASPLGKMTKDSRDADHQASIESSGDKKEDPFSYKPEPILTPDAEKKINWILRFDPNKSPEQKAAIQQAYLNAKQADEILSGLPKTFNDMANEATVSGMVGRNVDYIPVVGHGLGPILQGAGQFIRGNGEQADNRRYASDEGNLREALQNASSGPAASPGGVDRVLEASRAEHGDLNDPETYLKKIKNIESYVKRSQKLGLLDAAGLTTASQKKKPK